MSRKTKLLHAMSEAHAMQLAMMLLWKHSGEEVFTIKDEDVTELLRWFDGDPTIQQRINENNEIEFRLVKKEDPVDSPRIVTLS